MMLIVPDSASVPYSTEPAPPSTSTLIDRIDVDEAHFDAGTIGGRARVVQPLAVHEHEHARRVEAAQPRPHLKRTRADDA